MAQAATDRHAGLEYCALEDLFSDSHEGDGAVEEAVGSGDG